jgi:hypothetical protein
MSTHDDSRPAKDISLRDYFAAKAMTALIATPVSEWPNEVSGFSISVAAYMQADAMLEARSLV